VHSAAARAKCSFKTFAACKPLQAAKATLHTMRKTSITLLNTLPI
jgi:hypothetical protein